MGSLFLWVLALATAARSACVTNPVLAIISGVEETCTVGVLDIQNNRIARVADPQVPGDAISKSYLDHVVKGNPFAPFVVTPGNSIGIETWDCDAAGYAEADIYFPTFTEKYNHIQNTAGCGVHNTYNVSRANLTPQPANTPYFYRNFTTSSGTAQYWPIVTEGFSPGSNHIELITLHAQNRTSGALLAWFLGDTTSGNVFHNDETTGMQATTYINLPSQSNMIIDAGDILRFMWASPSSAASIIIVFRQGFTQAP